MHWVSAISQKEGLLEALDEVSQSLHELRNHYLNVQQQMAQHQAQQAQGGGQGGQAGGGALGG